MNKFLLIVFSLTIFTLSSLDASIYRGQRVFIHKCLKCHKSGQDFIKKYRMREWKKLMRNKGKPLAEIHLKSEKARKSWKYFESRKYTKKSKHLKQFLIEYAKDSGNVPACN